MGSSDESSNLKNFTYTNRQLAVSPFSYIQDSSSSYCDSSFIEESQGNLKCSDGTFFIEEPPSWVDELLSQPQEPLVNRVHRRSASESFAGSSAAALPESFKEDSSSNSNSSSCIWDSPRFLHHHNSFSNKSTSSDEKFMEAPMEFSEKEEANENVNLVDAKSYPAPKPDSKRAKQQSAHRSRVRKLKYISELERTVQILQAEGSEIHAELEFINQQNLILSMENRALRQRLDSLSQEQLIKHFEQEMLERELTRLQTMYQIQSQQQLQMQQHHPQNSKHRRTKSKDLLPQFANLSINKEASPRVSVPTSSVRI